MDKYRKYLKKKLSLWLPVILWAIVIFLFSAQPTTSVSKIDITDFIIKKTAHIIEYAIFTTLLYRAIHKSDIDKKRAAIYSVITALFYGLSDEFHQSFTPGRDPKLRDVLFDTTGAMLAIYFIKSYLPKAPERFRKLAKDLQII